MSKKSSSGITNSPQKAIEKMYENTGLSTEDVINVIENWIESSYGIQSLQRDGIKNYETETIENAILKSNVHCDKPLYRGIFADEATVNKYLNALQMAENDESSEPLIERNNYTTSWTTSKDVAKYYSKELGDRNTTPIIFELSPNKYNKVTLDLHNFGTGTEHEVLMSKKAKFVVDNIRKGKDGILYVHYDWYQWK